MPRSHIVGVAATVQNEMQKHASLLSGVLTHKERKAVSSFIQAPEDLAKIRRNAKPVLESRPIYYVGHELSC